MPSETKQFCKYFARQKTNSDHVFKLKDNGYFSKASKLSESSLLRHHHHHPPFCFLPTHLPARKCKTLHSAISRLFLLFFCAVSDISCSPCLLISSDMLLLFEWAQGRRVLGESEEFHTHYIAKILTRDLNGQITYIAKKNSLLVTAVRIPLKQATKIVLKWRALRGIRESSECRS